MQLLSRCNICSSRDLRPYALSFDPNAVHNSVGRCANCGIYFANPMRSEAELNEFYASQYYENLGDRSLQLFSSHKSRGIQLLKADVMPLQPPPGRFLEIGSGYGPILSGAKELGYEVIGIELSNGARSWAEKEQGLEMRAEILENCGFEDESFNVIYAWHVIEHVPDMARFLNEVRRVLKPNGVFLFGTENYRCIPNLFSRVHHLVTGSLPGLDTANEHTFLFTPESVRRVFPLFGYKVHEVRAYQPHHKRAEFFRPARRGSAAKRILHHSVLGIVYALATLWPGGGAHLRATVRRD